MPRGKMQMSRLQGVEIMNGEIPLTPRNHVQKESQTQNHRLVSWKKHRRLRHSPDRRGLSMEGGDGSPSACFVEVILSGI